MLAPYCNALIATPVLANIRDAAPLVAGQPLAVKRRRE
jgi:hypothetical protein